jgi:hypothetical protein
VPRALWGFGRGVKVEKVGAERERGSVARDAGVKRQQSGGWLDGGRPDWQSGKLRIEHTTASVGVAGYEPTRITQVSAVVEHCDTLMRYRS